MTFNPHMSQSRRLARGATSIAASLSLLLGTLTAIATITVAAAPEAQATNRISQQTGFNARAWTVTSPDASGTRYVGGDFTSYKAWDTGNGAAVDATTGVVDPTFPKVSSWPYSDVVVPDGTGGWFIGGGINNVGGDGISRLAHLNADGSLDTGFAFSFTGGQAILALALDDTALIVGGSFTAVDGQSRTNLAAFDVVTKTLMPWAPVANGAVHTLKMDDTQVYIGGNFSQLAGQARGLAGSIRLDERTGPATGTCLTNWDNVDCLTSWNPNVGGWGVKDIVADDTYVWLGGAISSIGGQARSGLGRVLASTGAVDPWDPALNSESEALALDDTALYVGGLFTVASGVTRNNLAAYDTTTGNLLPWNPDVTGNTVKSIQVDGGSIYVGGRFQGIGGQARNHAAVIDRTGAVGAWDPHVCNQGNGVASYVYGLSVSLGKVYLIGDFPCVGGQKRLYSAAVSRDGLLTPWAPSIDGPVFSFSRLGNTIYMAGGFSSINGTSRQWAGAVDTSGAVTAWNPTPGGDRATDVLATPDRVYISGFFSSMGGNAARGVAVVDLTTGAVDNTFDPQIDGPVRGMWLDDTSLFIGGDFGTVGGEAHVKVASIDATTGAVNSAFTAGVSEGGCCAGDQVEAVAVVGSRLYIGGYFQRVNGEIQRHAGAVNKVTGALDTGWRPVVGAHWPAGWVFAIEPSVDGSTVFLGGTDNMSVSSGSGTAYGVAELDAITGELTTWRADTGEVRGISTSSAAVFLAGSFSSVGGESRQNTAAVDINGNVLDPWPMDPATSSPLSVVVTGTASGAVVSAPGGINCGDSCEYAYNTGSTVTLTAVPDAGAEFSGWTGDCSGTATTCTLSVTASRSAAAQFATAGTGGGGGGGGGAAPTPLDPPTPPRDLLVVSGDRQLTVSWQPPLSQGSFPVTNYRVTAQPGGHTCLTSTTSCQLTNLTNGVSYSISVQALSGAGWSPESAAVLATPEATEAAAIRITALPRIPIGRHDRIAISGTVIGLAEGQILRPYLQLEGQRAKVLGNARVPVRQDGTIRWQRKIRPQRDVTVYFKLDGVRSNAVTWQRVR